MDSLAPSWQYGKAYHQQQLADLKRQLRWAREDRDQAEDDYREAWRQLHRAAERLHDYAARVRRLEFELAKEEGHDD